MSIADPTSLDSLRAGYDLTMPGDAAWDEARATWNLTADLHPSAVIMPRNAEEVVEIVRLAREAQLRVAPQSTGHNAMPLTSLDDTILLKTSAMRDVEID